MRRVDPITSSFAYPNTWTAKSHQPFPHDVIQKKNSLYLAGGSGGVDDRGEERKGAWGSRIFVRRRPAPFGAFVSSQQDWLQLVLHPPPCISKAGGESSEFLILLFFFFFTFNSLDVCVSRGKSSRDQEQHGRAAMFSLTDT